MSTYITNFELGKYAGIDTSCLSDDEVSNIINRAGDIIDAYLEWSLINNPNKIEKSYLARYENGFAYYTLDSYVVNLINSATLYTSPTETTVANVSDMIVMPRNIVAWKTSNPGECSFTEFDYDSGLLVIPDEVKTACAYICRSLLKAKAENGANGFENSASTQGAKMKGFRNREYEETYTYGNSSGSRFDIASSSENEMAYRLLEKYKKYYP